MADGVLYKSGTAWAKTIAKKMGGTAQTDGKVQHSNGVAWYDNYPMEQLYTATFTATWSQGWMGDGTRLDDTAWFNRIITGSTTGYRGMYGFKQADIAAHIGDGVVQSARLYLKCYETTTNGAPDIQIGKHSYTSEPAGTWTGQNADWASYSSLHVNNQAVGAYWVNLNPSQIRMSNGAAIGGVALRGATNTSEDMGKWSSYSDFATKLEITVLK